MKKKEVSINRSNIAQFQGDLLEKERTFFEKRQLRLNTGKIE
jgi:hypothetical protein